MPVVNREIVLPVDRDRAWELITEPAELEEWLADEVEFEPEEDAPVRVAWDSGEEREGVVEQVTEHERIVFRWGDSRVEWALEDAPGGHALPRDRAPLRGRLARVGPAPDGAERRLDALPGLVATSEITTHSGEPRPPLPGGGHRSRTSSMQADGRRGQRRPVQSPGYAP